MLWCYLWTSHRPSLLFIPYRNLIIPKFSSFLTVNNCKILCLNAFYYGRNLKISIHYKVWEIRLCFIKIFQYLNQFISDRKTKMIQVSNECSHFSQTYEINTNSSHFMVNKSDLHMILPFRHQNERILRQIINDFYRLINSKISVKSFCSA